jgi:hypothetical protein
MAGRAQLREEDLIGGNAGRLELIPGRPRSIEVRMPRLRCAPRHRRVRRRRPGGFDEPAIERGLRPTGLDKPFTNVRTDFVAADANRWSGGHNQICRSAGKSPDHCLDGNARHACRQTSPTRVGGCHRARATIGHQERDAIGGLNRRRDPRIIREHDVSLEHPRRRKFVVLSQRHHVRAVYLADTYERGANRVLDLRPGLSVVDARSQTQGPFPRRHQVRGEGSKGLADQGVA